MSSSSLGTNLEVAQKRLALELEKLQVDKQLVRAEKKHLKQLKACQQEELSNCYSKIQQLESKLVQEKKKDAVIHELQEKLEDSVNIEHECRDSHEAVVGELEMKIAQQQEEIEKLRQSSSSTGGGGGMAMAISPSKASSYKAEIQQYKNKLQSLRLAMEVAVRRTETQWKQKVDELEVQMATAEGEFEDAWEAKTVEYESQITQLQQQLDYCEQSHQEERMQLEATIERLQKNNGSNNGDDQVSVARDEELRKTRDELRSLQKQRAETLKNQQAVINEANALIDQINKTTAEPEVFQTALPSIKGQTAALESSLNVLQGKSPSAAPTTTAFTRKLSRKFSQEAKLHKVENMEWSGSNQKGKYTGFVSETNEPHGRGILEVDNGDCYQGEWKHGRRHGQGMYTWAAGDLYTGPWNRNRRHGHGVFVWSDGRLYDGEYNMGKREGKGAFTWPYGAKYEGDYRDNKRNGYGVYVHADGRTYTGEYSDDRPHGKGVLTDAKGTVVNEGNWNEGRFMGDNY